MWGGPHARQWGALDDIVLNDGQSNHIAVFPTFVKGGAAQFDLWRKAYAGLTLPVAIKKWSGGNSNSAYASFLVKNAGIGADEPITNAILSSPRGLELMKQQARWEAGKTRLGESYPMSDFEWMQAQQLVFGPAKMSPPPPDIPVPQPKPQQPASGGFFSALINAILAIFNRSKS
jgi:hypothetical protein